MFTITNNVHTDLEKLVNRCIGNTATGMIITAIQSHLRHAKRAGSNPTLDERTRVDEFDRDFENETINTTTGEVLNPALTHDDWMAINNGTETRIAPMKLAGLLYSIRAEIADRQETILVNPDSDTSLDRQYRVMSFEDLIDWQVNNQRVIGEDIINARAQMLTKLTKETDPEQIRELQKRNVRLLRMAAVQQAARNTAELKETRDEILNIANSLDASHDAEDAFRGLPVQTQHRLCVGVMDRLVRHRDTLTNRFMRASNTKAMMNLATEMELVEDIYKQLGEWLTSFNNKNASKLSTLEDAGVNIRAPLELAA